jgi:ADP-heptose:LPS heptosyltransferase
LPVVFLGSRSERDYYSRHFPDGINLAGQTTLGQAAAILRDAQAVVTTDNGLMHLAGAVSRRVVAIFGPTHPARKCPPGAVAVWADEDCYDPRYEFDGTLVSGPFFQRLTPEQIMEKVSFPC